MDKIGYLFDHASEDYLRKLQNEAIGLGGLFYLHFLPTASVDTVDTQEFDELSGHFFKLVAT